MTDLSLHHSPAVIQAKEPESLRALWQPLSVVWLILKDFRNGLLSAGVPVGKALEMVYVEPYQADRRGEDSDPSRRSRQSCGHPAPSAEKLQ